MKLLTSRLRFLLSATAAASLACISVGLPSPVQAQQHIDEPTLDPIFGRTTPRASKTDYNIEAPASDDAFDNDAGSDFKRARDLIGVMTFLTPDETNLSVGLGPVYRPDYFGSDDYEFDIDPAAYVRFDNFIFLDDDGADFALVGFSNFSFGPSIRIVGRRDEDDNPALNGLGDVGTTFEFGGFAATTFVDRFSVRFKVRKGIKTGHRGLIVDGSATALLFRWGDVSTSISGQASWIGDRYADSYFSVTPLQSARSGLPTFNADAGFRDIGGSFNAYINVRRNWSLNPYVSYRYIFDGFNDTPIIALFGDRNQFTAGFHLLREFQFGQKPRRKRGV